MSHIRGVVWVRSHVGILTEIALIVALVIGTVIIVYRFGGNVK